MRMIRKYHNHKPQTTPWHREEEPLNHHETPGRQIKQSNQLSLPHQDDCNTRMDIKLRTTKHRTITRLIARTPLFYENYFKDSVPYIYLRNKETQQTEI